MLKSLQKALGLQPQAEAPTSVTAMSVETLQTSLASLTADFEAFKAEADATAAQAETALAALAAELASAKTEAAAIAEKLAAVEAEKLAVAADAEAKRLTARKEKIVAAIGTDKSEALMTATAGLDDAAFEAVVSAMVGSVSTEAKSPLFTEVGASAEVEASAVELTAEMKILQDKYGKK